MKKGWVFLIVLLILTSFAIAQEPYHLKLLAVQEYNGTYTGSGADLFLELKKGSGRVFLDTFPLTKMDTQLSTRFAKDIACNHFKLNCKKYDFIYTIKADSNIIGGPSAGAAMATLTTIAVLDLDYNKNVTITGTINSGGIIGQVGGVKEKLEVASEIGLEKVLVAKGTGKVEEVNSTPTNSTNTTENINVTEEFNLLSYAKNNLSLNVMEVIDLDEVIFQMTGTELNHKGLEIKESQDYNKIMGKLQSLLCSRSQKIEEEMAENKVTLNGTLEESVLQKKGWADNATKAGDYYSAASYCFGLNIQLKSYYYREKNTSFQGFQDLIKKLENKTGILEQKLLVEEIETISDLQTMMIVKERISDVRKQISNFKENKEFSEGMYDLYAYAEERYYSAVSWMQFFAMDGKKLVLDQEVLKQSCQQKILEAEERDQYAKIFLGSLNGNGVHEKIEQANEALNRNEPDLCLIKAIQAKGDANAILSSLGLTESIFPEFIDSKFKAVERVIAENSLEGRFPILGYSYFQYANSLREQEKFTALIYLEYALEMGDLGIYFPDEQTFLEKTLPVLSFDKELVFVLEGFLLGVFITLFVSWMKPDLFGKKRKIKKSSKAS